MSVTASVPAPAESILQTHQGISSVTEDTNTHVEGHQPCDNYEEPQEWELDDDTARRLASVAFHNFNDRLHERGAVLGSPNCGRDLSKCLPGTQERKLTPDVQGAFDYFLGQVRQWHGSMVAAIAQMNNVRTYLGTLQRLPISAYFMSMSDYTPFTLTLRPKLNTRICTAHTSTHLVAPSERVNMRTSAKKK